MKLHKKNKLHKSHTHLCNNPKPIDQPHSPLSPLSSQDQEEDYEIDFSIYEQEEKNEIIAESIEDIKNNKARISNLRSKYGNSIQIQESIILPIRQEISKYAIKVASDTGDSNDLWSFYGCLNEYWANIKFIFGTVIQEEISKKMKEIYILLISHANQNKQNRQINNKLLILRDDIYLIGQRANLGIEVEKIYNHGSEAKKGIVE
jgi:hypothetical protein